MERRDFLKTVPAGLTAISSALFLSSCRPEGGRPNVILIITDDQGYGDFGFTGNPVIKTPHFDGLARSGASMSQFYVHPVCSPTRACLMTGRYNYRTRCIDTYIGRSMMDPEEVTIAEILRGAGYATGIFGKWHLGDNHPLRPQDQGFDEVLVHRGGGIGQPSDPPGGEGKYTDPVLFHNGNAVQEKGYCTDVYFRRAMDWMERVHRSGQNFFLYLPTNAPHSPLNDVPSARYEEYLKTDLGNDRFPQERGHKLPEDANADMRARIYSMITNIDDNVGKLVEKLRRLDILDNTLILAMVDNGPNTRRYVAGMRGMKSHVYEGGIRSPLILHWPSGFEAGRASDRVSAHIDILPTVLEACRVPVPEDLAIDGRSLMPLLKDPGHDWPDRHIVIQTHRGDRPVLYHHFAIRNQEWKLLHASGFGRESFEGEPRFELYDMVRDPLEMVDVSSERQEIVARMKGAYERWFEDVSRTRPDNYDPPRIHVGTPHENPVVLTRQNWRSDKAWSAEESMGYWMLHAPNPGTFDVRVRFRRPIVTGDAVLQINARAWTIPISGGEVIFEDIVIERGDVDLQSRAESSGRVLGAWQVEVTRKASSSRA